MRDPNDSQEMPIVEYAEARPRLPWRARAKETITRFFCWIRRHPVEEDVTASDIGVFRTLKCRTCRRSWWR